MSETTVVVEGVSKTGIEDWYRRLRRNCNVRCKATRNAANTNELEATPLASVRLPACREGVNFGFGDVCVTFLLFFLLQPAYQYRML